MREKGRESGGREKETGLVGTINYRFALFSHYDWVSFACTASISQVNYLSVIILLIANFIQQPKVTNICILLHDHLDIQYVICMQTHTCN